MVIVEKNKNKDIKAIQNKVDKQTECFVYEKTPQIIRTNLINFRLSKSWKQEQLAQFCNVQVKVIKDIENGTALYDAQMINKLNQKLKVNLRESKN
jgi:ribosome-binding protein aMBF1 (putative translation factor)